MLPFLSSTRYTCELESPFLDYEICIYVSLSLSSQEDHIRFLITTFVLAYGNVNYSNLHVFLASGFLVKYHNS